MKEYSPVTVVLNGELLDSSRQPSQDSLHSLRGKMKMI